MPNKKASAGLLHGAVFADSDLEQEFFLHNLARSQTSTRWVLMVSTVVFGLFGIMDFLYLPALAPLLLLLRLLISAGGIVTVIRLHKFRNDSSYSLVISLLELSAVALSLWSSARYGGPRDALLIFIGLLLILLVQFSLPLNWNQACINAAASICFFFLMNWHPFQTLALPAKVFCLIYLFLFTFGFAYFSYTLSRYKHKDFLDNHRLVKMAVTDPLTGIYNRSKFDTLLEDLPEMLKVHHMPSVIAFFDFDDFKLVNDRHGHLAGDHVIIETVNLVQNQIRRRDLFCRWGGEEFTILFPDTRLSEATGTVERIRIQLAGTDFGLGHPVTASFGVAELQPGETVDELLKRVDALLYRAKANGKNRTEWDPPESDGPGNKHGA